MLGGGSSRADVLSLLYLRPAAILALAVLARRCLDWRTIRSPALLLAALAAVCAVQLVPMPPALHGLLPGWQRLDAIQRLNGTLAQWRGATLDPDATWNALFSLVVPAAVLAGLGAIPSVDRRRLLVPVMAILLSGAVLGVVQVAGGQGSPFYLYRDTYPGYAVGWFSNRNHHAASLACLFPLLRIWAERHDDKQTVQGALRYGVAGVISLLVLPMIVITGSRAGIALGLVSLVLSAGIMPLRTAISRRAAMIAGSTTLVVIVALGGAMLMLSRAASLDRLLQSGDIGSEGRIAYISTEWRILTTFWPWGTGIGGFDPAIRMFEPDAMLHLTYFNHAHNDFLEMALTAGVLGILLMMAVLAAVGLWTIRVFRHWRTTNDRVALARAASVVLWIVIAASAIDYPLRTPLMAALMTIAVLWLRDGEAGRPVALGQRRLYRTD